MQLNKALHKATRNHSPCCVRGCGRSHPTWAHNKTPEQIDQHLKSRQKNPKDVMFVPKSK